MNRLLLPGWWKRDRPRWSPTARQRIGIPAPRSADWGLWELELKQTGGTP